MFDFSTPTWKSVDEMQQEINMLHQENAQKLEQIITLESILYETRKKEFDGDCGACWCEGYLHDDGHTLECERAREATRHLWSK